MDLLKEDIGVFGFSKYSESKLGRGMVDRQKEKFKLPENHFPEEIHLKAGLLAKSLKNLPPMSQKELKEKLARERINLNFSKNQFEGYLCS